MSDDDTMFGIDRTVESPRVVVVVGGALTREIVEAAFRYMESAPCYEISSPLVGISLEIREIAERAFGPRTASVILGPALDPSGWRPEDRILFGRASTPPAFLMGLGIDPTPDPVQCQPPPKRAPRRGPERPVRPPIVWRQK